MNPQRNKEWVKGLAILKWGVGKELGGSEWTRIVWILRITLYQGYLMLISFNFPGRYQMFVAYLLIILSMGLVCLGEDYRTVHVSYQPCKLQLCNLKFYKESDSVVNDQIKINVW